MILQSLLLQNYKQYGELKLDFREGLVGIIGKNGAGKSTLFEAVLYCLYGKDEINNKELMRSSFADGKLPVKLQLDFLVGEIQYSIQRELRGKKLDTVVARLFKNDELIANSFTAVNDTVAKLLNLDREAFKRSVFSGQKELSELSDTKGEKRTKLVRRMLGLETLDEVQNAVRSERLALNQQMAGQVQLLLDDAAMAALQANLLEKNTALDVQNALLREAQEKQQGLQAQFQKEKIRFDVEEERLKNFNRISSRLSEFNERLSGLKSQKNKLETDLAAMQVQDAALKVKEADMLAYQKAQEDFKRLDKEKQRKVNLDGRNRELENLREPMDESKRKLAVLEKELVQREQISAELAAKTNQLQELEKAREAKLSELTALKNLQGAIEERIRDRRAGVDNLHNIGKDGTCPTCYQPVRDAYDSVLDRLMKNIDELENKEKTDLLQKQESVLLEGRAIKATLEETQRMVQNLRDTDTRLKAYEKQRNEEVLVLQKIEAQIVRIKLVLAEIGEVHFEEALYNALKKHIDEGAEAFRTYQNDLNYLHRTLPENRKNLETLQTRTVETVQAIELVNKELEQLGFQESVYQQAKNTLLGFDAALQSQNTVVNTLMQEVFQLQTVINQFKEKLTQQGGIRARVADKKGEVEVLEKLEVLLKAFKTDMLERVSPGISREASGLFSRITKGKYESIKVDENFEFFIADGGVYYPIERFSGGEIDLANFCLRIAITKAIMELSGNGQGVEFLAFDEIFGSQDEERRHEMMLALHYLQEQFRQIYIVSHIESQRDYFPHILEVKATESGSVTRWVE